MDGRVVVVTGATGKLGPAVAQRFATDGDRLALVARDRLMLDGLVSALPGGADRHLADTRECNAGTCALSACGDGYPNAAAGEAPHEPPGNADGLERLDSRDGVVPPAGPKVPNL